MNEEKKLNKNYITIAILTALALVVVWLLFSSVEKTQPLTVEQELALQEQAEDIIETGNIEGCEQIDNEMYRSVCRNNIALGLAQKTLDIKECRNIDNSLVSRDECERQVVLKKSVEDEDISVCDQATSNSLKNECKNSYYLQLALKNNDSSICNFASDSIQQNMCKDTFMFQTDFTKNANIFDCEEFSGDNFKNDCKNMKDIIVKGIINPSACISFNTHSFAQLCRAVSNNPIQVNN